jgi:hypothetical protein
MRRWARFFVVLYGLMLLVGLPIAIAQGGPDHWWQAVIGLVLGLTISWRFVAKPALVVHRLRKAPPHQVAVTVSEAGVSGKLAGREAVQRYWGELVGMFSTNRGTGIVFRDGTISWLPRRAFQSESAKRDLETFVRSKLPLQSAAVP